MDDRKKTKAQLIAELEILRKRNTEDEFEKKGQDLEVSLTGKGFKQLWETYSHSPIPSLILSKQGKIIKYNNAMKKLTGYTHNEVPDLESWMFKIYPDEKYRKNVSEISRNSRKRKIELIQEEL